MISRLLNPLIQKRFFSGKVILLFGARQVGKTTLLQSVLKSYAQDTLLLNADDPTVRQLMTYPNTEQLRQIIGAKKILFIDEAQRIKGIGLTSKLMVDEFPEVQLILSGSSAFDLAQETSEPLTGRKWSYQLWPISWQEWEEHVGFVQAEQSLENRLVYGFYPDVLNHPEDEQSVLRELADSYLYKDVLLYGNIKKPELLNKLLQALAYQLGSEVAYKEVGDLIGADAKTVSHYIDLLEKAFVLFRLPALSGNLRNEIKTTRKIYFYDNGIRNAVIGHFQPLAGRMDTGALWENFLVSERIKHRTYRQIRAEHYFWRSKAQQEVDYVELREQQIYGFEFKWNPNKKVRFPTTFSDHYQSIDTVITRANFRDFVMPPA